MFVPRSFMHIDNMLYLGSLSQKNDIASEALNNFKKNPLHVLTDANVLVLIDTDQSIFEHRKFSGNSFKFGNFRFLKKLPVF